jgi:phage-related holin
MQKLGFNILLGTIYAPVIILVEKYLLKDYHLLLNLFILVIIDTVLGVLYAYKQNRVSSTGFSQVITKLLVYILLMIAVNQSHLNTGDFGLVLQWLDGVVYSTIVIRELLSIIEKSTLMGYIKLPDYVKEKLEKFND